jgi:hypothetical protein
MMGSEWLRFFLFCYLQKVRIEPSLSPVEEYAPCPGLPDFSWQNIPKRKKHTKYLQNIPNDHGIFQKVIYLFYFLGEPLWLSGKVME